MLTKIDESAALIERTRRYPGRTLLLVALVALGVIFASFFHEVGRSAASRFMTSSIDLPDSAKSPEPEAPSPRPSPASSSEWERSMGDARANRRQDVEQINQSTKGDQSPAIANTNGDVTISFDGKAPEEERK